MIMNKNETVKSIFIAAKIVERLELLAKDAERLHCSKVGIVICDYFADIYSPIHELILETTWRDFFEDIGETSKNVHILYGDDTEHFVEEFANFARNRVRGLMPYIVMELFHAGFPDCECKIIDQEDNVLFIKARIQN